MVKLIYPCCSKTFLRHGQRVKHFEMGWASVIDSLRTAFGHKTVYKVCREFFSKEQDPKRTVCVSICQAQSILPQLDKNSLNEQTQIDMV